MRPELGHQRRDGVLILERLKAVCQLAANFSLQPLADRGRRGLAADHLRHERGEVVGRRRGEAEELVGMLGHRVLQPQLVRVQHGARRALGLESVPVGVAVDGIAEQGVAQVLHVHAHLVRAARANQHRHHRAPPVMTEGVHEARRLAALALGGDRLQQGVSRGEGWKGGGGGDPGSTLGNPSNTL